MQTRVRARGSVGSAIAAMFIAFSLAGCSSSLDDPAGLVNQLFRQKTGTAASSVSCPADIPIAKGHEFTCTVQAQGESRAVTLLETTATSGGEGLEIVGVS